MKTLRKNKLIKTAMVLPVLVAVMITSCKDVTKKEVASLKPLTDEEHILRGQYLVTIGGCHDCHSPKIFGPQGMEFDPSKLLSGHPEGSPLPSIDLKALEPGQWVAFLPDLTGGIGPWGLTFARNLTPHETGIKGWTFDTFVKIFRTGKHMGAEQGRPVLPPMPWFNLMDAPEEDLKSIYLYLNSLPPINNHVPAPLSPDQVVELQKKQILALAEKK
jgi:hypothetical protein